jgi:hypothetical protein
MADVWRVDFDGARLVTGDSPAGDGAAPPGCLLDVIRVRVITGDPIATSIVYAGELPDTALEGQVCTTGNGEYMRFGHGKWIREKLLLDDAAVLMFAGNGTIWDKSLRYVDALTARMNPLDYITGGSAGAQSVSFPSVADVLAFYKAKRDAIASMAAGFGGPKRVCVKPYPVGGVYG